MSSGAFYESWVPRFTAAWLALAVVPAFAAPAARVEFAIGNPVAVSSSGQSRSLTKGAPLESGDAVKTNDGRVQLHFSDGAYVSLQPQTDFRIDDYRYDQKSDGSERGFFSLIKGGLRTITGLVGRINKKNYRITTTVATIGIRGTEYTIALGDGLQGSVGEGEVEVCSGAGCVPFSSGQSFIVTNPTSTPQLTGSKTDLPPNQPQQPLPSFVSGDQTNANGEPNLFILAGPQVLNGVYSAGNGYFFGETVIFDSSGAVTQFPGFTPVGTVTTVGNDGIVAWGNFAIPGEGGLQPVHFVVGLPVTDFSELHAGNVVATYSLLGATVPTDSSTGAALGKVNAATMTVRFGDQTAAAMLDLTLKNSRYVANMTGSFDGPIYLSGSCSVGSCSAYGKAQVFGTNAPRAGLVYDMFGSQFSASGAVALTRQ